MVFKFANLFGLNIATELVSFFTLWAVILTLVMQLQPLASILEVLTYHKDPTSYILCMTNRRIVH